MRDPLLKSIGSKQEDMRNQWFWYGLIGSQLGLIIWEFIQINGRLIFDVYDLIFTIVGGITAIGLYKWSSKHIN